MKIKTCKTTALIWQPTRRQFGVAAIAGLGSFCAGCAVNPATGDQQVILMSSDEERRIGAIEHPKILQEFGGAYDDPKVSGYIAAIGGRLAATTELPGQNFTFTVLNSPIVNAMALPGGYVYLTRGLLALAQNEAEAAGVIGHEIGHVVARHTAARISRAQVTQFGLIGLAILGGVAGLPSGTGQIANSLASLHLRGFSRDQEFEADTLGIRYMSRAGYDADAMASFLAQLRAHSTLRAQINGETSDTVDSLDIMATHPRTLDRIKRATTAAGPKLDNARNLHREAYHSAIDGMIFGDDPDSGVIRGRKFAHRALRFCFEVPEGFTLVNRPNAVIARHKALRSTIIFDLDSRRNGGAMTSYLIRDWAKSRMNDVASLTVNGLAAATGSFVTNTKKGQMVVRLLAIRGGPSEIFRFMFLTPATVTKRLSVPFRRTTYSFGRLSLNEASQITPLRMTILRRQNGSLKSLVRRMQVNSHASGWFELLNGFASGNTPKPGDAVRLVV
jgi:predicted Zn-dependent protease